MIGRLQATTGLLLLALCSRASGDSGPVTAIEVRTKVSNAVVFIDGAPEGSKLNVPISIEPGSHEISVEAAGHAVYKKWIHVEAGQTLAIEVELLPLQESAPLPKLDPDPRPGTEAEATTRSLVPAEDPRGWYERWWVWAAVGVLLVGGTTFLVAASGGDDFVPAGELGRTSTRDWMSR